MQRTKSKAAARAASKTDQQVSSERDALTEENKRLNRELEHLRSQLSILKELLLEGRNAPAAPKSLPSGSEVTPHDMIFRSLTTKQHVVLQMAIAGAKGREIAERMGVSLGTVKVHLDTLFRKFSVHTRVALAMIGLRLMERVSDEDYLLMARIPKNWSQTWTPEDPYKEKYLPHGD
jgi:DNA-binding NarL/FixJ family response regulator